MSEKFNQAENLGKGDLSKGKNLRATIGESVSIVGDVTGKEDFVVNGNIEGDINFRENNVIVGENGRIHSNVTAKNITIEGEVKGELRASEQVTIKPSGRVSGDIRAPRVILDDGCQFKGSVDMDEKHSPGDNRPNRLKLSRNRPASREHPIKTAKKSGKI